MPLPEHVLRFWRALDARFESVHDTQWGAVVTDRRFPAIWDANYARIDSGGPPAGSVARELRPRLEMVGAPVFHTVSFDPESSTGLLSQLSTAGHSVAWDLVMGRGGNQATAEQADLDVDVEEITGAPDLWDRVQRSFSLFGVRTDEAKLQLRQIEEDVMEPAGKRWFGIRRHGRIVSLGAMLLLEGVGYVDNVATFPRSRGRGYAGAIVSRIARESAAAGSEDVILLADPGAAGAVGLYERLGFLPLGRLVSTKGPIPTDM